MFDEDDGVDTTAHATLALRLLNWAQDLIESEVAKRKNVLQTADNSMTTAANTETSTRPTRLRRIDSVWMLDSNC